MLAFRSQDAEVRDLLQMRAQPLMEGGSQPLVVTCQGASERAQRAARSAALLDREGAAVHVREIDAAVGPARRGRRIVALDGCPAACSAHRLRVMALEPFAALNLVELSAADPDADRVELDRIARMITPMLQAGSRGGRRRAVRARADGQGAPRASQGAQRHRPAKLRRACSASSCSRVGSLRARERVVSLAAPRIAATARMATDRTATAPDSTSTPLRIVEEIATAIVATATSKPTRRPSAIAANATGIRYSSATVSSSES